ncbi:MAG: hypothetical protein PHE50_09620 [Dehalococcoidales bacterium]|nr:hypothetical protein [Dehalococcoidales bacterium]
MANSIADYVNRVREIGPVAWCEGPHGWIGEGGQPITLTDWQRAALSTYWQHRTDTSTFAISNVKKTGKTFTNAILTAYRWLALPGQHFTAGNDLDQSQSRQFDMIAEMVKRSPFLSENVKIGKSELVFTLTGSKLTALAADAAGNAGSNQLTSSHTEAWGILYEAGIRAWEELTPPPGKTYGLPALRIADSYQGFTGESKTWHKLIDRGLAGERLPGDWPVFKAGGLLLFHMEGEEAQERCFRGTEAERLEYYTEQAESLRPNAFTRMHHNQRTSGESAFVTEEQWQACYSADVRPFMPGEKVKLFLGADASTSHDYTSLVGCDEYGDVRLVRVWKPKKILGIRAGKPTVDLDVTIGQEVINLYNSGNVSCVVYDPWQLAAVATKWEKAGIKTVEMPQTAQRVEADTALFNAIISGQIRHYKNADLDEAVRNAIVLETPRGIRLAKEKASRKIDPLVALSMANSAVISGKYSVNEITVVDNPFYIYSPYERQPDKIYVTPHPDGVTWRNCRKRQRGICQACQKEMESEGVYENDRLREIASRQRTEAYVSDSQPGLDIPDHTSPAHGQAIASLFWNSIRNKGD